jgi:hypothetical protein
MFRVRSLRIVWAACLSAAGLSSSLASAQSIFTGNLADWAANPVQITGDKVFTYLSQSGTWSGAELVTLSSNVPQLSHSLSIDALSDYVGPFNLSVGYQVDITTPGLVFQTIALDANSSGSTTMVFKDIFDSLEAFDTNVTPGSGTWSLLLVDSEAGSIVGLPPLSTIWVRDTLMADFSGSLLGISNTVVQVPEPSSCIFAAIGLSLGSLGYWRRRATTRSRTFSRSHSSV